MYLTSASIPKSLHNSVDNYSFELKWGFAIYPQIPLFSIIFDKNVYFSHFITPDLNSKI